MRLNPCKLCGGEGTGLARITCRTCGARTRSFVATSGEFQSECDAAAFAWNRGEYEQPVAQDFNTGHADSGGRDEEPLK